MRLPGWYHFSNPPPNAPFYLDTYLTTYQPTYLHLSPTTRSLFRLVSFILFFLPSLSPSPFTFTLTLTLSLSPLPPCYLHLIAAASHIRTRTHTHTHTHAHSHTRTLTHTHTHLHPSILPTLSYLHPNPSLVVLLVDPKLPVTDATSPVCPSNLYLTLIRHTLIHPHTPTHPPTPPELWAIRAFQLRVRRAQKPLC
ncbi:hypothetical protein GQ44DRAFT_428009 [Phaeosphaeriaceae sp. PMI808]|nr:hypothetical protein GQ44DRAFT_428009 [Phaeosphaeriaceae sp. PMI808]